LGHTDRNPSTNDPRSCSPSPRLTSPGTGRKINCLVRTSARNLRVLPLRSRTDIVMLWRAQARRFPVLAIRDFRLLLADRLLAPASAGFSMVGVSFAVLNITGSAADLSYVLAAQIAPMLVFSLVGGVAADRFPPQRVIIAANLAM